MRQWILEHIKNILNFRDKDGKPNYTHIVGLLFSDEIEYLKKLNIDVKTIGVGYNQLIFNQNINK